MHLCYSTIALSAILLIAGCSDKLDRSSFNPAAIQTAASAVVEKVANTQTHECAVDKMKILESVKSLEKVGAVAEDEKWTLERTSKTIMDLQLADAVLKDGGEGPRFRVNGVSTCGKSARAAYLKYEQAFIIAIANPNSDDFRSYSAKDQSAIKAANSRSVKDARDKLIAELERL